MNQLQDHLGAEGMDVIGETNGVMQKRRADDGIREVLISTF